MGFDVLADLVAVLHATFLAFVGVGALFLPRAPGVAWLHVPAAAWGVASISIGSKCPLTALEKRLRNAAGEVPYTGGFVDRYVENVVYPEELTPLLWALAAVIAVVAYAHLVFGRRAGRRRGSAARPLPA